MGIFEVGILIHKTKLNEYSTEILLHCVDTSPVICNVKVTVSNKRHITTTLVIVVSINHFVNIFLRFSNTGKLIRIKINEIHCIVKLFIKESSVILIEKLTFSNI